LVAYGRVILHQVVLKHFFLALALGAAMPLNYALITFFIIVTFWIDKYNVLRLYKKPAEVNHQVRLQIRTLDRRSLYSRTL
jgi:hypothetical protein